MGIDAAVSAIGDAIGSAVASAPVVDAGTALAATAPAAFGDAAAGAVGDVAAGAAGDAIAGGAADALGGAAAGDAFNTGVDALAGGYTGAAAPLGDVITSSPALAGYSAGDIMNPIDASIMNGATSATSPLAASGSNMSNLFAQGLTGNPSSTASNLFSSGLSPTAQAANTAATVGGTAANAGQGASTLATIAKLLPLAAQVAGMGTKMPGTISQQQLQQQQGQLAANQQQLNQGFENALNAGATRPAFRTQTNPNVNYSTYGQGPQQSFFNNINPVTTYPTVNNPVVQPFAKGGQVNNSDSNGDGGQSDTVPAQLSEGEYVVPADAVSALGDGNTNAGAGALQRMVKGVRMHKSNNKGGLPPKAKSPLQYMAAGGLPRPYPVHLRGQSSYVGG